jgi:hypothetical protein
MMHALELKNLFYCGNVSRGNTHNTTKKVIQYKYHYVKSKQVLELMTALSSNVSCTAVTLCFM